VEIEKNIYDKPFVFPLWMQALRQEIYMYLSLTNFVLDFVNIPKRNIIRINKKYQRLNIENNQRQKLKTERCYLISNSWGFSSYPIPN